MRIFNVNIFGLYSQAVSFLRISMLISFSLLLASCGGGGGAAVNHAPVVFAGADFTITVATAGVPLTATISDPDGNPLTIQWTFTSFAPSPVTLPGSAPGTATFSPSTGSKSTAVMVNLTTIGLYTFTVTASDGRLSTSNQVVVNFTNELVGILPKSLRDAPVPLNTIPVVPVSAEVAGSGLNQYVPDTLAARAAALKLGKALFWDMQVGSNGQACASCHFNAGVDNRIKNTMSSGPNGVFKFNDALAPALGPNQTLTSALFPLHLFNIPDDRFSGVLRTTDDVVGAEGVFDRLFLSLNPGSGVENSIANPIFPDANGFSVGGVNVRRVTGRNAPTAINAVFNLRNFLDGRARHHFNGVNPFGNLDTTVTALAGTPILRTAIPFVAGSVPAPFVVTGLNKSSLASQAVGPPLSDFEMSHGGKNFPTLGKKLLDPGLVALGTQLVDPTDSVLGGVSNSPGNGITDTYTALIQTAFAPEIWNSTHKYTLGAGGIPVDQ
ncbi:MAG: cytochrome c peroxidase, partial [Mariprofundus sp.]|nr:cytochrome c peroxidase [Mariprofundus sp.]